MDLMENPAATATGGSSVLNLEHLNQYTLGDSALQGELLGMFRDQLHAQSRKLESATDARAWMQAAHTLKGAARAVGAFALADAAERLEDADFADETRCIAGLRDLAVARQSFEQELLRLDN